MDERQLTIFGGDIVSVLDELDRDTGLYYHARFIYCAQNIATLVKTYNALIGEFRKELRSNMVELPPLIVDEKTEWEN